MTDTVEQAEYAAESSTVAFSENISSRVTGVLEEGLRQATRRVEKLAELTESSVLSIGESVESIVCDAQEYAKHARATLEDVAGSNEGKGIAQLVADQNEILSTFVAEIQKQVAHQAKVADAAISAASKIRNLGNQITSVAAQSRLLSLNASIEAARIGTGGRAFGVIASEMTNLSRQVEFTSHSVNTLVENLSETLPGVAEAARDMRTASESFIGEISDSIQRVNSKARGLEDSVQATMHSGDETIAKILSHSQDALSALQFQDPVAQGLVGITRDFQDVAGSVEAILRGESTVGWGETHVPESRNGSEDGEEDEDDVEAGEVMLF